MTEYLPTPHSIALASLIALYSDPHSDLYPQNTGGSDAASWPTRLSALIRRSIREGEGSLFDDAGGEEEGEGDAAARPFDADGAKNRKPRRRGEPSVDLRAESLSSLLSRIDAAFRSDRSDAARSPTGTAPSRALLSKLSAASRSVEHLYALIDEFHSLLEGRGTSSNPAGGFVGIDGDSMFGIYLRKLCLGAEELPFEAMSRLWVCFGGFVSDAIGDGGGDDDAGDGGCSCRERKEWIPSSSQVDGIVKKTLRDDIGSLHERRSASHDQNPIPSRNRQSLNLLSTHPECPSLHFLLFYKSLIRQERTSALESLHRYFDYGMISERKERAERSVMLAQSSGGVGPAGANTAGNDGFANTGGITTAPSPPNESRRSGVRRKGGNIMLYAAILLAQTYHRFHHPRLALQATREAMRVAQQGGDEECVIFARAWLGYIEGNGEMLRRCLGGAAEWGLGKLAAGVSLELGRWEGRWSGMDEVDELEEGVGSGGLLGLESVWSAGRAGFGSARGGGARGLMAGGGCSRAAHRGGGQSFTDVDNMTSTEALSILGRRSMAISGLWDSTGHSSMASLSSQAALYAFRAELNSEDATWAMQRVIASFSYGPGLDMRGMQDGGRMYAREQDNNVYSLSLNHLSSLHGKGQAFELVQSTSSILHEWSVRSFDLDIARSLQYILANHAAFPSAAVSGVEVTLTALSRETHLHIQEGDFEAAKIATQRAYLLASRHSSLIHQGWQLLQLALINLEASMSAPSSNMSVERSLPTLLECLHLAEQYAMDPLRAAAMATLAKVLLCIGRFRKARTLLNAALPLLMQHGHLWFQAEACLTLAKCNLAEACGDETSSKSTSGQSVLLRRTALSQLEKAASLFEQIDDIIRLRQTYYLQAMVCNAIPHMQTKRDECATKYSELSKRRQSGSKVWKAVQGILLGDTNPVLEQS